MSTWQCTAEDANVSSSGPVTGTNIFSGSIEDDYERTPHIWRNGWIRAHRVTDTSRKVPRLKQLFR